MKKPRVLFLITDSGTGGAEKVLLDHLLLFDRSRLDPCGVVVLKEKRELGKKWEEMGIPVVALGMKRFPTPLLLFRLLREIKKFKPDVLNSFTFHSFVMGRVAHFFNRSIKVVSNPCLNYRVLPTYAKKVVQWTRDWDDFVVCEGSPTRDFLVTKMGFNPEKTRYVPNGIFLKDFEFREEGRKRVRQEWGIKENECVVGAVGRLHDQKGFDYLVEALALLKDSPVPFRAFVIGEGPRRKELETQAKNKHVPIHFLGIRQDVTDVLSAFDVYVQSSRYEGQPIALLEAMGIGCSIVATAVDGTRDLAEDGENMLLVRPDNPLALSVGIGSLLEKPELRKKLSTNVRESVKKYPMENMIRSMEDIYEQVIS